MTLRHRVCHRSVVIQNKTPQFWPVRVLLMNPAQCQKRHLYNGLLCSLVSQHVRSGSSSRAAAWGLSASSSKQHHPRPPCETQKGLSPLCPFNAKPCHFSLTFRKHKSLRTQHKKYSFNRDRSITIINRKEEDKMATTHAVGGRTHF